MTYADYNFYAKVYSGDMSELEFTRWSQPATAYIDTMTHGRAASAPDSMKRPLAMAFCEVVDSLAAEARQDEETAGGAIQSANNDGLSVTYRRTEKWQFANQRLQSMHTWLTYPVNLVSAWI